MGLFSSKYVTNVATSTARVIEDSALPDAIKHGAVKGLFDGGDQFIENVLEELINSVGVRAERMFNYGKNKYNYGLPSSTTLTSTSGQSIVQTTIAAAVGQAVIMNYYHFGALNNLHLGLVKLIADHGFNPNTGQLGVLSAAKGKPVKMTNLVVVVTEASLLELSNGSLDHWDSSANAGAGSTGNSIYDALLLNVNAQKKAELFELDTTAANDYLRVEYVWQQDTTVVVEGVSLTRQQLTSGSFNIQILGFDEAADWHQAKYTRADGQIGYWLYKAGTGTYPAIDQIHVTSHAPAGSYYPWGYFRFNGINGAADKNSDWFKQSTKLMKYVGIDYEDVSNAINENPDIDKVEQAMLMMAVPAVTTNQVEMRYLFDYFMQMLETTGGELNTPQPYSSGGNMFERIANQLNSSRMDASIVIQDARFKMALGFRHISHKIVQGTIGAIGDYASGWGNEVITETGSNAGSGTPVSWNTNVKSHWYQKQTTPTQYEEVRVNNLQMTYFIYNGYNVTADEDDDILLIPLDRSITSNYSIPVREELYARSLHYIFNSRVVTEVKWYQQGWFRGLLIIAAIVITVMSWGETWQSISLALAAGTITIEAVVYMIALAVLKYVAISLAIKLFVRVVGVEFAIIVAIVAATMGMYQVVGEGSLANAPWATELLQISSGLTQGINNELSREFKELAKEAEDFSLFVESEQKRLDAANKLLENTNWMTPMVIFGEKPDDFYHRTVHSGNIGVLSLDAISAYVDVSLTLPKLTDTL